MHAGDPVGAAGKAGIMKAITDGGEIMETLDAMRKTRRALNRRMRTYRETVEPLFLFQALQEKREAVHGVHEWGRDFQEEAEEEKSLYEEEVGKPMRQYLQLVEAVTPAIAGLPLKEAGVIMLYYGLGKSWADTARALHTENRADRLKAIMRAALAHCGVPAWMIRGRVELFPTCGRGGALPRPGVQGEGMEGQA